jgi:hypothetical protein
MRDFVPVRTYGAEGFVFFACLLIFFRAPSVILSEVERSPRSDSLFFVFSLCHPDRSLRSGGTPASGRVYRKKVEQQETPRVGSWMLVVTKKIASPFENTQDTLRSFIPAASAQDDTKKRNLTP